MDQGEIVIEKPVLKNEEVEKRANDTKVDNNNGMSTRFSNNSNNQNLQQKTNSIEDSEIFKITGQIEITNMNSKRAYKGDNFNDSKTNQAT